MSQSNQMNDSNVYGQQLIVNEISIPFTITANATAASKTSTVDAPAVMFLNLNGTGQNNVTSASGALPAGANLPTTFSDGTTALTATADGASSVFYVYIKLNQYVKKVLSASITSRLGLADTAGFSVVGVIPGPAFSSGTTVAQVTVPTPGGVLINVPQGASSDGQGFYVGFSSASFNLSTTNVDAVFTARFEAYS